jgi:hypothetical protein
MGHFSLCEFPSYEQYSRNDLTSLEWDHFTSQLLNVEASGLELMDCVLTNNIVFDSDGRDEIVLIVLQNRFRSPVCPDDTVTDAAPSLLLVLFNRYTKSLMACYHNRERRRQDNGMGWFVAVLSVFILHTICRFHSFTTFDQRWENPRHQSS